MTLSCLCKFRYRWCSASRSCFGVSILVGASTPLLVRVETVAVDVDAAGAADVGTDAAGVPLVC